MGNPAFSFLTYGPSYLAGDLDQGVPSEWFYGNQLAEMAPGSGIPNAVVRRVVHEVVRTGTMPTGNLDWRTEA